MPAAWPDVFQKLAADPDRQVRSRAMALGVTFGDPAARADLPARSRRRPPPCPAAEALAALLQAKDPTLAASLARAWCATRAGRSRDPGALGLRRSGDAGCVDHGVRVAWRRPSGATP